MIKVVRYESEFGGGIYNREDVYKRLRFLTNGGHGRRSSAFHWDLSRRRPGKFFLAWENGTIIGWAFVTPRGWNCPNQHQLGLYVEAKNRGRGVADRLIASVKKAMDWKPEKYKENPNFLVACPFSKPGERLFQKHEIPLRAFWVDSWP